MGFFSNLFGKKSQKLTKEQIEAIEEKVELTQKKQLNERNMMSDLPMPKKMVQKPSVTRGSLLKKANKSSKKKVKGKSRKSKR